MSGVRYFAFIRAINVGGHRLTNDELTRPFVDLGLGDVVAYQASGNITFCSDDPGAAHPDPLEAAMGDAYGFEAPVFVRTRSDLEALVATPPFSDDDLAGTERRIQVAFTRSAPDAGKRAEALALVPEEDRVVFSGRHWLWLPRQGVGTSRLPVGAMERLVGPLTIRTLRTIERLLDKFD